MTHLIRAPVIATLALWTSGCGKDEKGAGDKGGGDKGKPAAETKGGGGGGGEFTKTLSFTFPAIAGPDFTLRYENTRMVASGSGSAKPDMTGTGTVTLTP